MSSEKPWTKSLNK
jgi:hypothetical protein